MGCTVSERGGKVYNKVDSPTKIWAMARRKSKKPIWDSKPDDEQTPKPTC